MLGVAKQFVQSDKKATGKPRSDPDWLGPSYDDREIQKGWENHQLKPRFLL